MKYVKLLNKVLILFIFASCTATAIADSISISEADKKKLKCEKYEVPNQKGSFVTSLMLEKEILIPSELETTSVGGGYFQSCNATLGVFKIIHGPVIFDRDSKKDIYKFNLTGLKDFVLDPYELKCDFYSLDKTNYFKKANQNVTSLKYKGVEISTFLGESASKNLAACDEILSLAKREQKNLKFSPNPVSSIRKLLVLTDSALDEGIKLNDIDERHFLERGLRQIFNKQRKDSENALKDNNRETVPKNLSDEKNDSAQKTNTLIK